MAEHYLKKKGYEILCKNFQTLFGEIDIVAKDDDTIVFIEVKTRNTRKYGAPEDAITLSKRMHLIKSALFYLSKYSLSDVAFRFDVIAISPSGITHYKNAFSADDSFF